MNLIKNSFNLLVIILVLSLSASVRSQDEDSDDAALAAAVEAADSSSSGSDTPADISDIVENAFSSTKDAVGSSSSGSDSRLNDIAPALAAAPVAAVAATRPGIPRLGSGYLLEQFRNFNLPGRIRGWTERVRNLRLGERARQFRAGLVINPDSLAYRTGRRFTLSLQSLAKRVRDWGERVRARQGAGQNEITRR